jgi:hypothetical protein
MREIVANETQGDQSSQNTPKDKETLWRQHHRIQEDQKESVKERNILEEDLRYEPYQLCLNKHRVGNKKILLLVDIENKIILSKIQRDIKNNTNAWKLKVNSSWKMSKEQ